MAVNFAKGTTPYIQTGTTFSTPTDWSVYAWVRRASAGGGGNLFSIGSGYLIDCYYSNSTADRLIIERARSVTRFESHLEPADDRVSYAADKWVFIAITQSGTSTPVVYTACPADSVALGTCTLTVTTAGSGTATTSSSDIAVLGNWSGHDWSLGGDLAWFGFHNVALTAGEISEAMWRGMTPRGAQLLAPLDEGVSALYELSGNAHTLTNSGATTTTDPGPPIHPLWLPMAHGWVPVATATTYPQTITATGTGTATMSRSAAKVVSVTAAGTASMVKQAGKALAASAAGTASLATTKVILIALSAVGTGTATMARSTGKVVAASATGTAMLVRDVAMTLTAGATASASLVKRAGKALAASSAGTASLAATRVVIVTLTAAATGTATMARLVGKVLSAGGTGTPAFQRLINKTLAANATGVPSLTPVAAGTYTAPTLAAGRYP